MLVLSLSKALHATLSMAAGGPSGTAMRCGLSRQRIAPTAVSRLPVSVAVRITARICPLP